MKLDMRMRKIEREISKTEASVDTPFLLRATHLQTIIVIFDNVSE